MGAAFAVEGDRPGASLSRAERHACGTHQTPRVAAPSNAFTSRGRIVRLTVYLQFRPANDVGASKQAAGREQAPGAFPTR